MFGEKVPYCREKLSFFREKVAFFMKSHQLPRNLTLGFSGFLLLAHLGFLCF